MLFGEKKKKWFFHLSEELKLNNSMTRIAPEF